MRTRLTIGEAARLAGGDLEEPEKPDALKLAEERLAEHLSEVSPGLLEQDRKLWTALDAFEWPEGFWQNLEAAVRYYGDHPDEYRVLISLAEPLVVLADLPADAPEVERLAEEFARRAGRKLSPPAEVVAVTPRMPGPLEAMFEDIMMASLSPAQRRFWKLVNERLESPGIGRGSQK